MDTAVAPGALFPVQDELLVGITYENVGIEEDLSGRHSVARVFKPEMTSLLSPPVEAMTNQGRIVMESFKPVRGGHAFSFGEVSEGAIDDWWRPQLRQLQDWGQSILIIYAPERESADEAERFGGGIPRERLGPTFAASYKHLLSVWEDIGAPDNIRFIDTWAGWNFGMEGSYTWLQDYHVDDDRLWAVGADPYGWCPASGHGALESLEEKAKPALRFCREVQKPLVFPEVACYRFDGRPRWIYEAAQFLESKPRIKAVCWFERQTSGCDWRLKDDPESLRAWDELMQRSRMRTL